MEIEMSSRARCITGCYGLASMVPPTPMIVSCNNKEMQMK